ncbi:hypothetical protein BpHYR1_000208 [Brachionus plicatilis]|uniref:Uncharacterized protein n=1 Tax=Brachionus plicatilis TaxID=10195 RepID=A0A3M7SDD2_BRAPC|nr:hypothetical protein BpHYR1_000208 [Brachionus plicatilis]
MISVCDLRFIKVLLDARKSGNWCNNFIYWQVRLSTSIYCWDPYKRTLNRPKFSETMSALAGQTLNGGSIFWTAKINESKNLNINENFQESIS